MKTHQTPKQLLTLFASALLALAILALARPLAVNAAPLGTAFNYQGRLTDGGNAANGTYDLQFAVYDSATPAGSIRIGNMVTNAAVGVAGGLFTVTLDFGANVFTGPARWLNIGVRTNGGVFTNLTPRTALLAVPYAIYAGQASTVTNGAISVSQLQTPGAPTSGQALTYNGTSLVWQTLAPGSSAYVAKAGDTMTGTLNLSPPAVLRFGAGTRQMISLYDNPPYNFGIGVQSSTFYQRTDNGGGFAWYQGGVHSDAQNDPGMDGTTLMTLNSSGDVSATRDVSATGQVIGNSGVYGTSSGTPFATGVSGNDPSGLLNTSGMFGSSTGGKGVYGISSGGSSISAGVWGENTAAGGTALVGNATGASSTGLYASGSGYAGYFQGNVRITANESFGSTTRQMINLWSTSYGIGVQNGVLYERGNGFAWFVGGSHAENSFDPGTGGTKLMSLDSFGDLDVTRNAFVCTLTIRGGCDVAEPFQMSTREIPKGAVVVIDDENAGRLKLSERAYDSRVAGIVSGANGINSGLSLHQEGAMEGGQNVALSGRVYVLADASSSPIKPGDLLTTSDTPGHAMKVADHGKAQGAILGKAMSGLKEGQGMVLVLVTLQ